MASVNNWTVTGNITRDVVVQSGNDGGVSNIKFSIAADRTIKGEKSTYYVDVLAYGRTAESAVKYGLRKGDDVAITGEVSAKTYQKKDGTFGGSLSVFAREIISFARRGDTPVNEYVNAPQQESDIPF